MAQITSSTRQTDIGDGQRVLSAVAGSLLLYFVSKKHKVESLLLLGGSYLLYRAISGHCPVTAVLHSDHPAVPPSNINIRTHVVVNRPRADVYAFWRRLENWPLFMRHLENVDELDPTTSAWRLRVPGMADVRWEAKIVKDEKNTELSWHSVPGAAIETTGKINFSDTPGNATRVDVLLSYKPSQDAIGERLSRLLTPAFRDKVFVDIHNFKHYFEDAGVGVSQPHAEKK
jgi:uncharacterized membrane protein